MPLVIGTLTTVWHACELVEPKAASMSDAQASMIQPDAVTILGTQASSFKAYAVGGIFVSCMGLAVA